MASQQQASNTPLSKRDSWQTPQWLFDWVDERFKIFFDLAASKENNKLEGLGYAEGYYSIEEDALSHAWVNLYECHYASYAWCNPPYSETGKWLKKAWEESQNGFRSVFLVPTPNGENYYKDHVFGKASEIIFINGRISFETVMDNGEIKPVAGNTRGSCLVVFDRRYEGQTLMSWVNREDMKNARG